MNDGNKQAKNRDETGFAEPQSPGEASMGDPLESLDPSRGADPLDPTDPTAGSHSRVGSGPGSDVPGGDGRSGASDENPDAGPPAKDDFRDEKSAERQDERSAR
jgi:hypothetical protein